MHTGEILLDKNQVLAALGELPDRVSSEELIERILFIKLIESRLLETAEVSNDQVMQMIRDTHQTEKAGRGKSQRMISWKESAQEEVRVIYDYLFDQSIAVADDWSD